MDPTTWTELVPWGAIGAGAGCLLALAVAGARACHQRKANATPNPTVQQRAATTNSTNQQTAEEARLADDLARRRAEEEGRRQRAAIAAREQAATRQRNADRGRAGADVEDVELEDVASSPNTTDPDGEASTTGVGAGGGGTPVLQATLSPLLPQTPTRVPERDLGDPSPRAHLPDPLVSM